MIRSLWFFIKLGFLIAVAVWLTEHPGTVSVAWQGYVVETSVGITIFALVALVAAAALLYRFARAVVGAPAHIGRRIHHRRRENGYRALTRGMVAVAAGDAAIAQRMARRADILLNEPPLTMLLSAQAAQLNGDDDAARRYFKAMLERPETAFLGLRGLLTQSLRGGKRQEALDFARKAHAMQPGTPWLLAMLFELEARAGNWSTAESMLQKAVGEGALTPDDGRRHRTVLFLEQGGDAQVNGRRDEALSYAESAHDVLPGFVPAAVRAARLLVESGNKRRAIRVVTRAWKVNPHPELAEVFAAAIADEVPLERVRLFQKLASVAPDHAESLLAVAVSAMDAHLWGEARGQLQKAAAQHPTRRVFNLLARLERNERNDEMAARAWLAKGASAPADPSWICSSCGTAATVWAGRCPHCGAFDSLEWTAASSGPGHLHTPRSLPSLPLGGASMPTVIEATR